MGRLLQVCSSCEASLLSERFLFPSGEGMLFFVFFSYRLFVNTITLRMVVAGLVALVLAFLFCHFLLGFDDVSGRITK